MVVFGETSFEVSYAGNDSSCLTLDGKEVKPGDPVQPNGSYSF